MFRLRSLTENKEASQKSFLTAKNAKPTFATAFAEASAVKESSGG